MVHNILEVDWLWILPNDTQWKASIHIGSKVLGASKGTKYSILQ